MDNIVFIGFMCSGKTTVGLELAKILNYSFIDTDDWISNSVDLTISEIFDKKGEEYFRQLESDTIKQLSTKPKKLVLSTGGGLSVRKENIPYLKNVGKVIYLKVSKDTVLKRLGNNLARPLLAGDKPEERIEALLKERDPIYEEVADIIIDTNNKSIAEIINELMDLLSIND